MVLTLVMGIQFPIFAAETTTITIIHTNDTHGNVADDGQTVIGFAKLATYVEAMKAKGNVIVVDAGDMFQGLPFANIEEGHSIVSIVNEIGYDAMVPGNHEFDFGADNFMEIVKEINFKVLSANILKDSQQVFDSYIIKEIDGVKVGIFGLSTPETAFKTHPDNVKGYVFEDIVASAEKTVKILKEVEKVDAIVALTHLGLDEGDYTSDIIAKQVAGIDVMIDGHSHTELPEGRMVGDTLIASTKNALNNIGQVEITLKDGKVVSKKATLLAYEAVKDVAPKENIVATIQKTQTAQDELLKEVVGTTQVDLIGEREVVRTGESNLGQLAVDAMLKISGADIAMINGGGIRATIKAGEITKKDLVTVFPYGNTVMVKALTGQDLLDMLEWGVNEYPNTKGGFPHTGGLTFTLNGYAPVGSRISDVKVNGVPLDSQKTYTVVTNDFIAAGGDGYEMFTKYPVQAEYNTLMDVLMDYIKALGEVEDTFIPRMTVNTQMPIRAYAQSLGFKVTYCVRVTAKGETPYVKLSKEDMTIELYLHNANYIAEDKDSKLTGVLEQPLILKDSTTFMDGAEFQAILADLAA
jgi:5'-nucleotidase